MKRPVDEYEQEKRPVSMRFPLTWMAIFTAHGPSITKVPAGTGFAAFAALAVPFGTPIWLP
jgi:hypothetical protein